MQLLRNITVDSKIQHLYIMKFLQMAFFNIMRTGDADLRFYITTVQDE